MFKKLNTKKLATIAIISAIYSTLTLILMPISFGPIQFRISEALTILPLIFPEAVIGLTIGCLISNMFGYGVIDIVFGTLATAISALLTYFIGKKIKNVNLKFIIGAIPPVIINAIIVPIIFILTGNTAEVYIINFLTVLLGQVISVYAIGFNLYLATNKIKK
jgi:uncharacterized membrane protein